MPRGTPRARLPRDQTASARRDVSEAKTEGGEFRRAAEMPRRLASTFLPPGASGRSAMCQKLLLNRPRRRRRSRVKLTQPLEPNAAGEHLS